MEEETIRRLTDPSRSIKEKRQIRRISKRVRIVLHALLMGLKIDFPIVNGELEIVNTIHGMGIDHLSFTPFILADVMSGEEIKKDGSLLGYPDLTLNLFIAGCQEIDQKTIIHLANHITLNELNLTEEDKKWI